MNNSSLSSSNLTVSVTDFASWRPYFYICYIIFGGLALFTNLVILSTLIKHRNLMGQWPTVSALTIGNLSSALHSFCYGVYRLPLIQAGIIDQPLSGWICMASLIPTCHVLSYSVPPVIQCIIGVERITAICAFNWYRVHWSAKKTWYALGIICSVTIVASVTPLWIRVFSVHFMATMECSSPRIIGLDYLFAVIRFAILVGVVSALFSIVAAVVGRLRMRKIVPDRTVGSAEYKQMYSQFKRQMKLSMSMLIVAIFDLILVTVPSILTVVQLSFQIPDSAKISLYSVSYCIYSTVNIVVCVVTNSKFREAVGKTMHVLTCKLWPISETTATKVQVIPYSQREGTKAAQTCD